MATSAKKTSAVKGNPAKKAVKPAKAAAQLATAKLATKPAKKTGPLHNDPETTTSAKAKPKTSSKSESPKSTQSASPGTTAVPRLTVRSPEGADELKQKIGALATATAQIRNYKRALNKNFFDIGLILKDIDERKLYEVKGYGSFEAFLEREIDLGKQLGLKLSRAVYVFQREAAVEAGLERVSAAIAVFDGEVDSNATSATGTPTSSGGARSPIPFHKL